MQGPAYLPTSLTTLVLAVCMAINVALIWQDYNFAQAVQSHAGTRRTPYPGELAIEHEPVILVSYKDGKYKLDADDEWASMFPRGLSLERTTNTSRTASPHKTLRIPSLYNQLWCLNTLRQIHMTPGWANDGCRDRQVHTCLNLLRQGALCTGDTALEPPVDRNHSPYKVPGYQVEHVCRDWAKVRAVTEAMLNSQHHR
ncbi:hypothetical protein DFP72DRAFT_892862 [Ephemerocybe angulata]|uniref:Uncharacterized protein n=1 Tax=Ephemerocybe angulata TaxID=980116 RepID=A0A8H6I419_9AGAR|nr:hypothetical protein DFP72DRAFT_892862 [Tulosesus angulatus]